ncbi:hypothetical protein AMS59_04825 [Lysinibacillus sp. FJAT-14745]|uniref:hypothetical protein n=1 Tax=Lysinibacillus sp. FJAT-14745 TaxID=1704289 RepID=UPI0006AB8C44|nr:hypothetical protein [Lysinibacillus sp. FJAT-14745]KOP80699.1 hypothetical protein AMS59_04825 [Lysinibacillus sp. FJAT-14745]
MGNILEIINENAQILGLFAPLVAIIISVFALNQTKRSIEEANRPYVVVYRDYIQVLSSIHEYLVIKNFGKSGAIIDSVLFEPSYYDSVRNKEIFNNISDTFIAPGQSISKVVSTNAFAVERNGMIKVTIKYHAGKKKYQEVISLNEEIIHDLTFTKTKPSSSHSLQEVITKATEELLRRNL